MGKFQNILTEIEKKGEEDDPHFSSKNEKYDNDFSESGNYIIKIKY